MKLYKRIVLLLLVVLMTFSCVQNVFAATYIVNDKELSKVYWDNIGNWLRILNRQRSPSEEHKVFTLYCIIGIYKSFYILSLDEFKITISEMVVNLNQARGYIVSALNNQWLDPNAISVSEVTSLEGIPILYDYIDNSLNAAGKVAAVEQAISIMKGAIANTIPEYLLKTVDRIYKANNNSPSLAVQASGPTLFWTNAALNSILDARAEFLGVAVPEKTVKDTFEKTISKEWFSFFDDVRLLMNDYEFDISNLTGLLADAQNVYQGFDFSEGGPIIGNGEFLVESLAHVKRNEDVGWNFWGLDSWTWTNQDTIDQTVLKSSYIAMLAATSVYRPFLSKVGDEDYIAALQGLGNKSNVGSSTTNDTATELVELFSKIKDYRKPLYVVIDSAFIDNCDSVFGTSYEEYIGTVSRVTLGGLIDLVDKEIPSALKTISGQFGIDPETNAWTFLQTIPENSPEASRNKPSNLTSVETTNVGANIAAESDIYSGSYTSTLFEIGNKAGTFAVTQLVLRNIFNSLRNTIRLEARYNELLYVNIFGDIVLSDNTIVLPSAANPIIYDSSTGYNPFTVAFMNNYPQMYTSTETLRLQSFSDTGKYIFVYEKGAKDYVQDLFSSVRELNKKDIFTVTAVNDARTGSELLKYDFVNSISNENIYAEAYELEKMTYLPSSNLKVARIESDTNYTRSRHKQSIPIYPYFFSGNNAIYKLARYSKAPYHNLIGSPDDPQRPVLDPFVENPDFEGGKAVGNFIDFIKSIFGGNVYKELATSLDRIAYEQDKLAYERLASEYADRWEEYKVQVDDSTFYDYVLILQSVVTIDRITLFPYDANANQMINNITPSKELVDIDYMIPRIIAQNMYWYYTKDKDDNMTSSGTGQLRENFIFQNFIVEMAQGIENVSQFEKNIDIQAAVLGTDTSEDIKFMSDLSYSLLDSVGSLDNIIGIGTADSDPLFGRVIGFFREYSLYIVFLLLAMFIFRYMKRGDFLYIITMICLSGIFVFMFIFVLPSALPMGYNFVAKMFTEGIVSDTLLYKAEKYSTTYALAGSLNANDDYDIQTASLTLYRMSENQIDKFCENYNVNKDLFRYGDRFIVDPNVGMYMQGSYIKLNTDILFANNPIYGQYSNTANGVRYQLHNDKSFSSPLDYYTPYFAIQDGFVSTLNNMLDMYKIPRVISNYIDGLTKDSFIVYSYTSSLPFLYGNKLYELDFGISELEYRKMQLNFPEPDDFLNLTNWIENPTPEQQQTLWYKTMLLNGFYFDGVDGVDQNGNMIYSASKVRRIRLIEYVNYHTKRYLIANRPDLGMISDENLIKITSLMATFFFNGFISDVGSWVYPTSFNQEELNLNDVFVTALTKNHDKFVKQNLDIVGYIGSAHGNIGLGMLVILICICMVFSLVIKFSLPFLYIFLMILIIVRFVIDKEFNSVLKGYFKCTGLIILLYTLYVVMLSQLPKYLSGWGMLIALTCFSLLLLVALITVIIGFLSDLGVMGNRGVVNALVKNPVTGVFAQPIMNLFKGLGNIIKSPFSSSRVEEYSEIITDPTGMTTMRTGVLGALNSSGNDYDRESSTSKYHSVSDTIADNNYTSPHISVSAKNGNDSQSGNSQTFERFMEAES